MKKTKISRGVLLALFASSAVSVMSGSQAAENTEPPHATGIGSLFQDYTVTSGKWAKIATPDNTIVDAYIVSGPGANDRVFIDGDEGSRGVKILVNEIPDGVQTQELVVRIVTSEGFKEDISIAVIPKPVPVSNAVPTVVECGISNADNLDLGSFSYKYDLSTQDMIEDLHFVENAVYPSFIENIIPTLSRVKLEDFTGSFVSVPLGTGYTIRPVTLMYAGDPGSPTSRYGSILDNYNWYNDWFFKYGSFDGSGSITFDSYNVGSATGTIYYEGVGNDILTFTCPPSSSEPPITIEERKKELRNKLDRATPKIRQSEVEQLSEGIDTATHGSELDRIDQRIDEAVQRSEELLSHLIKGFVEDLESAPTYPEDYSAIRAMLEDIVNPFTYDFDLVRDVIKVAHDRWIDPHPPIEVLRSETLDLIKSLTMDENTREELRTLAEYSWVVEELYHLQKEAQQAHEEFIALNKLNAKKKRLTDLVIGTDMSVEDRELLLNVISNAQALSELSNMEKRIKRANEAFTKPPTDEGLAKEKARLRALLTELPVSDADYDRLSSIIKNAKALSELTNVEKDIRDSNRRFTTERDLFNRKLELLTYLSSVKKYLKTIELPFEIVLMQQKKCLI